jgi:hypothetical protein
MLRKILKCTLPVFLILTLVALPGCKEVTDTIVEDIKQSILDKINPFHNPFPNPFQGPFTPDSDIVKMARFLNSAMQTAKDAVQPPQGGWGMVRSWSGRVEFRKFGTDIWVPARAGMQIDTGDAVRTLGDYRDNAELLLPGGRVVRMNGDTIIQAPIWEPSIDRKEGLTEENALKALQIIKGRVWLFLDKMQHPSSYVTTPNAIAGVKGTEFEVIVDKNGSTTFNVITGVVEVSDSKMTKTVTLNAGQTTAVPTQGTPTAPASFDVKSLNRWWETPYPVNAEETAQINNMVLFGWIAVFAIVMIGFLILLKRRRKTAK